LFVGPDLYWLGVVKNDLVFNLVYRHGLENLAYVKRFAMPKFILGRDYRLFEADKRSAILLLLLGKEGLRIRASLAPSARAKHNAVELDLDEVLIKGVSAKGKRVANRTVRRVTDITGAPKKAAPVLQELPGLMPASKEESEEG
jgi:topoisomerase-4 subunit A